MSPKFFAQYGLSAVLAGGLCLGAGSAPVSKAGLIDAIKEHNQKTVEALIASHADVNAAEPDGATPLAWAVYLNETAAAEALLRAGAKVNTADEYGETPLTLACGLGNSELIDKLLEAGADANAARWDGETALMIAARSGSVPGVKSLIAHGAKLDAVDTNRGQNALMWAAAEGHSGVVDLLIKSGADIKVASKSGFNALVFATQKGDEKSVASLLAAGQSATYALPNGVTVLQVAVLSAHPEIARLLLDAGANPNVPDGNGAYPLHVAATAGDVATVKALLAKHADPNVRTAKADIPRQGAGQFRPAGEQTPLLLAARNNREDVMRVLIEGGADPKLKAQDGTTLLMAAATSGHVEVVKYAYELAPDIHAVTERKGTVMHAAVTGSMQTSTQPEICKVIQFLADKGADLDEVDARGRTPITVANILPIDSAVTLLANLIEASGKTPKQSPKR